MTVPSVATASRRRHGQQASPAVAFSAERAPCREASSLSLRTRRSSASVAADVQPLHRHTRRVGDDDVGERGSRNHRESERETLALGAVRWLLLCRRTDREIAATASVLRGPGAEAAGGRCRLHRDGRTFVRPAVTPLARAWSVLLTSSDLPERCWIPGGKAAVRCVETSVIQRAVSLGQFLPGVLAWRLGRFSGLVAVALVVVCVVVLSS